MMLMLPNCPEYCRVWHTVPQVAYLLTIDTEQVKELMNAGILAFVHPCIGIRINHEEIRRLLGIPEEQRFLAPEIPDDERDSSGYVYFIQSEELIKIGKATNLKKRLTAYKLHNPHAKMIAHIETAHCGLLEKELHRRLKASRYQGEWFHVSPGTAISIAKELIAGRPDCVLVEHKKEE